MEAKELRLGNYVDVFGIKDVHGMNKEANGDYSITVCRPTIHGNRMCEKCLIKSPELKPIPLTEEWLVRFGINSDFLFPFKFAGLNSCFDVNKTMLVEFKDSSGNLKYVKVKHLHQLQNIYFALTGEELTIK